MLGMLFDVFLFISTHISLVLLFPGSAETDIKWGENNSRLMASCARNIRNNNYYNWISLFQVIIGHVWDFFSDTVYMLIEEECIAFKLCYCLFRR